MSATFDATTTAAYEAATTAQARAQAIVASLTGTISVKVFNGSNVEMGSGTMASPWATAVSGVVVMGEVTEFTVGTTGTPDAGWYIRFQNADVSRWAKGSFGLAASGQDFTWSLDSWEDGQTGTIGTATIIASGNEAPVFTVAPTAASIAPTGGTIQFTAVDPEEDLIIYSLTTTRPGITINSSTGLVTVTSAAAGTLGNIVVRASDGVLTASTTCSVTVASTSGGIKWHPGFYNLLQLGDMDTQASKQAIFDADLLNNSSLLGSCLRYYWYDLEGPTPGSYDFSVIEADLAALQAMGKRIWVQLMDRKFGASSTSGVLPAYMMVQGSVYGGGANGAGVYLTPASTAMARLWDANVMDRKIALIQALGARFNSEPYFEGFTCAETAVSGANESTANDNGTFTFAALDTQLRREIAASVAAFPNTNCFVFVNFFNGYTRVGNLISYIHSVGAGVGGPDIKPGSPTDGQDVWTGDVGGIDYRGMVSVGQSVQSPELGGKEGTFTMDQLFNELARVGSTHVNWVRTSASQTAIVPSWADTKVRIALTPGTVTACPTNYPSCEI